MTTLDGRSAADLATLDPAEAAALGFLAGYRSENTRAAYGRDLRAWFLWCAAQPVPVLEAGRSHAEVYARHLEAQGRTPATVSRVLSTLAGFYRYATEEGYVDRNPLAYVRRPKVPTISQTLGLDRSEAASLIRAAEEAGPRDHVLACLMVFNGLRVSEVCALDIEHLSTERGHRVLTITRKGGNTERHPLAPVTAAAVEAATEGRTSGPLLLANDDGRLDRHDAARIVRRLTRRAGVTKPITPHSLRHTAATSALDAGAPLRDVQDMMGHADPRTTRRYDRARGSLDRHATYALAAHIAGA